MSDDRYTEILALHKSWADRFAIVSCGLMVVLFAGAHFLLGYLGVTGEARTGALVLLMAIALAITCWQAVGLALARVHMLIEGVSLRPPPRVGSGS
jgi:hypothetical protein